MGTIINNESLSSIPKGWNTLKLRYLFNLSTGLSVTKAEFVEDGIPCVNYGDIHSKYTFDIDINRDKLNRVSNDFLESKQSALVKKGDFIFCDTSEDIEGSGNCVFIREDNNEDIFAGSHTILGKPKKEFNSVYLRYLLQSQLVKSQVQKAVVGIKVFSITQKILKDVKVVLPPLEEQLKIADYLDNEVSRLDSIITTSKASISEYHRYKQSMLTDVLTKGLDFTKPKKETGIEWINTIPKHWDVVKLKYIFRIRKRIAGELGYDILSVTQKGLKVKDITSNEGQLSANYSKYQLVYKGDYVMNHMDLLTGWVDASKFNGVTSPDYRVFVLRDVENYSREYYKHLFQLCYTNRIFYGQGQGVSNLGRWRLQTDKFLNFKLPVPPLNEQMEIVEYIDKQVNEIDKCIESKEQLISELKQYKQSLIDEVVTAKRGIS